jgi:hypothetical protein
LRVTSSAGVSSSTLLSSVPLTPTPSTKLDPGRGKPPPHQLALAPSLAS